MIDDDRGAIQPGDRVLLIVEDDRTFARILLDLALKRASKLLSPHGRRGAGAGAATTKPAAITLDIHLPDMDGWTVLDRLKHDSSTRHIPVHVLSIEEDRRRGLALGAFSFMQEAGPSLYAEAFARIKRSIERREDTFSWWRTTTSGAEHRRSDRQRQRANDCTGERRSGHRCGEIGALRLHRNGSTLPDMSALELIANLQGKGAPRSADHGFQRSRTVARAGGGARRNAKNLVLKGVKPSSACWMKPRCSCTAWKPNLPETSRACCGRLHQSDRFAGGTQGAGRRRRRPQHLRAHQRARAPATCRSFTPRTARTAIETCCRDHAGYRHRADGHHDAGDGRLRNHAGDSSHGSDSARCPSSR